MQTNLRLAVELKVLLFCNIVTVVYARRRYSVADADVKLKPLCTHPEHPFC